MTSDLMQRIDALDTDLFSFIESQSTPGDRRSLLAIHDAIASEGPFSYLEIGSHLGGSLQVVVRDRRCVQIFSVDPRPELQPDNRGTYYYPDNSTARMLELLDEVPGSDTSKIITYDVGTDSMPAEVPSAPRFCFIDGEHTDVAVTRDAEYCRSVLADNGIITFHDSITLRRPIIEFLSNGGRGASYAVALPDQVFAAEYGTAGILPRLIRKSVFTTQWQRLLWTSVNASTLPRRGALSVKGAWWAQRKAKGLKRRLDAR